MVFWVENLICWGK